MTPKSVTKNKPTILLDVDDCLRVIKRLDGKINSFMVGEDENPHYEVTINNVVYGPMIETELCWFTHGLKARNQA
jgi:hypothetical protein